MKAIINEKIRMLYDFCILTKAFGRHDSKEARVREMLEMCTTEFEIERVLHDLLTGEETLVHLLARKGV